MKIIPRKWSEFQHYKQRSAPWVKLYHGLLDDRDFQGLSDASRALAPMLWLIASEHNLGEIDASPENLCFRLRKDEAWVVGALKPLMDMGFFLLASGVLAECYHDSSNLHCQERRGEERREEEKPPYPLAGVDVVLPKPRFELPDWVPPVPWAGYVEMRVKIKKPMTDRAKSLAVLRLGELRDKGYDPGVILDASTEGCWQGVFEPGVGRGKIQERKLAT